MKIPENTSTFQYYNANPKNRKTTDCLIRALCAATEISWESVLRELCEMAICTGYDPGDTRCYGKWLEEKGWITRSQPKHPDGTKYTGKEFCQELYKTGDNRVRIIHIGGLHLSYIKDAKIHDIWDCSRDCVGNYWMKL